MLVLSRERNETVMIGDDIEITIVDIRGDKVRLGINAPKELSVHRKEVYDAIRRENKSSPNTYYATVATPDDRESAAMALNELRRKVGWTLDRMAASARVPLSFLQRIADKDDCEDNARLGALRACAQTVEVEINGRLNEKKNS